jgi:2-keto-4-pentenoate hydratase/2-oxohepta-3-ene-1,7-dioic acid hydratase in catechol pathway
LALAHLQHPEPWQKGVNALTGPEDPIIIPKDSLGEVHFEGEAVAVIAKACRRVTPVQAPKYILGYTCGNNVSERAWQKSDRTPWRSNGADSFAPVGPWVETDADPQRLEMIVRVNGREVQHGCTKDMRFSFAQIVSYISQQVTLRPGDLVFSGSSGATEALHPGDVVEVEIPGVGMLRNPVVGEFDSTK